MLKMTTVTVLNKIINFRSLTPGWHYGAGDPISEPVIQRALLFCKELQALENVKVDAFARLEGEIVVTVYAGRDSFNIVMSPDESETECDSTRSS